MSANAIFDTLSQNDWDRLLHAIIFVVGEPRRLDTTINGDLLNREAARPTKFENKHHFHYELAVKFNDPTFQPFTLVVPHVHPLYEFSVCQVPSEYNMTAEKVEYHLKSAKEKLKRPMVSYLKHERWVSVNAEHLIDLEACWFHQHDSNRIRKRFCTVGYLCYFWFILDQNPRVQKAIQCWENTDNEIKLTD